MPHLHMEYTANLTKLDIHKTLLRLNEALVESGQFSDKSDIKSRALKLETFRVGTGLDEDDGLADRAFVHVKLALLSGRTSEIKQQLSQKLLAVLQEACEWPVKVQVQLCVEILDIDPESYSKVVIVE